MTRLADQLPSSTGDAPPPPPRRPSALAGVLATPEFIAVLMLAAAFVLGAVVLPGFDAGFLLDRGTIEMEAGLLALTMTFVIGAGHIDLSVGSILVLTSAVVATLHASAGVPLVPLVLAAPVIGGVLGAINGAVVGGLRLPSLIVTLATMASYRGLAQVLVGDDAVDAPEWFTGFHNVLLGGWLPMPVAVFLAAAAVLAVVLHKTVLGRYVLAMGTNPDAALYSGVPVMRTTLAIFVLSGVASGVAAMMMLSRLTAVEWKHAAKMELDVITAVVLGGASVFGGRATVVGSAVALVLIFVVKAALDLSDVPGPAQNGAVGAMLILAVLLSNGVGWLQGRRPE